MTFNPLRLLTGKEWAGWIIVLVGFCGVYGSLLSRAGGLPFGIDNNESFSSLVHAQNLYRYDFWRSLGLTDESYGGTQAAHPFIHSHQGNFPRLYAYLLYVLGAHTIESQIWVHTFTIGLAAYFLAFMYLSRVANPAFATLACLVFLADYLLIGQWHTNTYRVWHFFFFFSTLQCLHGLGRPRWRLWAALTFLNFLGLFYWEYVFASFIGLLGAFYALALYWKTPRKLMLGWALLLGGALTAAWTLLLQLTLYMGWKNVLRDISYTLHARNSAADTDFASKVAQFYDEHKVLFWPNYVDAGKLRNAGAFFDSLLGSHFQLYTPTLACWFLALTAAWWLGFVRRSPRLVGPLAPRPFEAQGPKFVFARWNLAVAELQILGGQSGFLQLFRGALHFALIGGGLYHWLAAVPGLPVPLAIGRRLVVAVLLTLLFGKLCTRQWFALSRLRTTRVVLGVGFICAAAWLASSTSPLFNAAYDEVWRDSIWHARLLLPLVETVGIIGALALIVVGTRQALGRSDHQNLGRLRILFTAIALAYVPTYLVFTGYVMSGYLNRQAPLLVFATDLMLALGLYVLAAISWRAVRPIILRPFAARRRFSPLNGIVFGAAGIAAILVVGLVAGGWCTLQSTYRQIIPPDNFSFIKKLAKAPYRGHSFAVSTYAAPEAVMTHKWAYLEPVLFTGHLGLTPRGFNISRENTYKWLGDSRTLKDYERPDYALVIRSTNWKEAYDRYLLRKNDGKETPPAYPLLDQGLMHRATQPFSAFLHDRVVDSDPTVRDLYAIAALDWDYPAFLAPLPRTLSPLYQAGANVDLNPTASTQPWRVWVEATGTHGESSKGNAVSLQGITTELEKVNWNRMRVADGDWVVGNGADGSNIFSSPGRPGDAFVALVTGQSLELNVLKGPDQGIAVIHVNDMEGRIDLYASSPTVQTFHFDMGSPSGVSTTIPRTIAGQYVAAAVVQQRLELTYFFAQQDAKPEENTEISLYHQAEDGRWEIGEVIALLGPDLIPVAKFTFRKNNPDTISAFEQSQASGISLSYWNWVAEYLRSNPAERSRQGVLKGEWIAGNFGAETNKIPFVAPTTPRHLALELPEQIHGLLQVSIQPGTKSKVGPEYASNTVYLPEPNEVFGAIRLKLKLPEGRRGQTEPLLASGQAGSGNLVYVTYEDEGHIRVGLDAPGHGALLSPPVPVGYGGIHEIEISHGSLFPPESHPDLPAPERESLPALRDHVRIRLDRQTILEARLPLPSLPYTAIRTGEAPEGLSSGERHFSGTIFSQERFWPTDFAPFTRDKSLGVADFGFVEMDLIFPRGRHSGVEPMVVTGISGAGDFVYVSYVDDEHVKIGFDHWGVRGFVTQPVAIIPGQRYHVRISLGSLFPPDGDPLFSAFPEFAVEALKRRVTVTLGNVPVMDAVSECYESPPVLVHVGENQIGGSSAGTKFTGELTNVRRIWPTP
jgi:hypothetical protein